MGEPLLCGDLKEILAYGDSSGIGFSTTSNGSSLSDKNIDLVLNHFSFFAISFDAGTKSNFKKIRIGANYEKTIEGIQKTIRRKAELGSKTVVRLN